MSGLPTNVVSSVSKLTQQQEAIKQLEDRLSNDRTNATIIFFDLVGSTGYRREQGAAKGIIKAHYHNALVSQAILEGKGEVAKWMGDGVLGYFLPSEGQEPHEIRALKCALVALKKLQTHNCTFHGNKPHADTDWQEEIHTRVGISSGPVHFISNDFSQGSEGPLDPIGSTVDLAARLESLAGTDVILVDVGTFWGDREDDKQFGDVTPICETDRERIPYRCLDTPQGRSTVYVPTWAPLFVRKGGVQFSQFSSPYQGTVTREELVEIASKELDALRSEADGDIDVVYGSTAIECNLRGFKTPISAVAISFHPVEVPAGHVVYEGRVSDKITSSVESAILAFRSGEYEAAANEVRKVLEEDERNVRMNLIQAMISRSCGDLEAAKKHLRTAKYADGTKALPWKLAGMIYFAEALDFPHGPSEPVNTAIDDFARARQLARATMNSPVEQCSATLLALALLMRAQESDITRGSQLAKELASWAPMTPIVAILRQLLLALAELRSPNPNVSLIDQTMATVDERLAALQDQINQLGPGAEPGTLVEQSIMSLVDLRKVVAMVEYNRTITEVQTGLPTGRTIGNTSASGTERREDESLKTKQKDSSPLN